MNQLYLRKDGSGGHTGPVPGARQDLMRKARGLT